VWSDCRDVHRVPVPLRHGRLLGMLPIPTSSDCFNTRHGNIVFHGDFAFGSSVGLNCRSLSKSQFGRTCSRPLRTPIVNLFLARSPFAIQFLIRSVIINPFKCLMRQPFSHVRQKIFKRPPSLANYNASTAVIRIRMTVSTVATTNHGLPRSVCPASFVVDRVAVSDRMMGGHGDLLTGGWVK
jgi:hypothetical protein